jgi:hypothetical protein
MSQPSFDEATQEWLKGLIASAVAENNKATDEKIAANNKDTDEKIAANNKATDEKIANILLVNAAGRNYLVYQSRTIITVTFSFPLFPRNSGFESESGES